MRLVEIIVKLIIAFSLYFFFTFAITILFIAYIASLINANADAMPPMPMTEPVIISSIAIFVYACLGLFLCWFVKRDLGDTLAIFTGKPEKIPTFFS